MFTVKELSEKYGTTRKTVYKFLKNEDIKQYVVETPLGLKLQPEGLNILNNIVAQSKIAIGKEIKKQKQVIEAQPKNELVESLKKHIESLEKDKERQATEFEMLFNELKEQRKLITTTLGKEVVEELQKVNTELLEETKELKKKLTELEEKQAKEQAKRWYKFWK